MNQPSLATATPLDLAMDLHRAGRLREAAEIYHQIMVREPANAAALHFLGLAKVQQGDYSGINLMRQSLILEPNRSEFYANLGNALRSVGDASGAEHCYRRSLEINPSVASVWCNLGFHLREIAQGDRAEEMFRRALSLDENMAEAWMGLGIVKKDLARVDEAAEMQRRALALDARRAMARCNLLYTLLFSDQVTPESLAAEHRQAVRDLNTAAAATPVTLSNDRSPERRLRIGYVSPHLRDHAVNFFIEPVFRHHDHRNFELFAYADVGSPDNITSWLRRYSDQWRSLVGKSDREAIEMIRADQIDVLIDLAGHLPENRIEVFAERAAPVQITYLGYQTTTGLETVDYRLTDAWADPPGVTDAHHSEELWRLPEPFFCWRPAHEAPELKPPPCVTRGQITFGSLNDFCKVQPHTVAVWSRVLQAVSGSRLLLLVASSKWVEEEMARQFAAHGIDSERIEFLPRGPRRQYLEYFDRVDVALDPRRFNGHTTVCDALWQGVPVVMALGDDYRGRFGTSVLRHVNRSAWIATTDDEYVAIATCLANAPAELARQRTILRAEMEQSPLLDHLGFTRKLEDAYRAMWRRWCVS